MDERHFEHDNQALLMGMLVGKLMEAGISHRVAVDDAGMYTPVMYITLEDGQAGMAPLQVAVMVLP